MVPPGAAADYGHAAAGELEDLARLGPGGDFEGNWPVDGFDVDFGAERSIDHRDGDIRQDVPAFALEAAVSAHPCLLYTSDAADDLLCVDLGGRRIINKT